MCLISDHEDSQNFKGDSRGRPGTALLCLGAGMQPSLSRMLCKGHLGFGKRPVDRDRRHKRRSAPGHSECSGKEEGLTLLGGEPFDQAQEAAQLAKEAKKHGLSVLTFTGYRLEELRKKGPAERKLLKRTDLLIDGPFEEEKKSFDRPLVGSSNQRFHFLTDRYKKEDIMSWKNSFEIRIDQDGRIWINGMGDLAGLRDYEKRRHSSNEISWD